MVADNITKEEAAMWVKQISEDGVGDGITQQAMANIICSLFTGFDDYNPDTSEISEKEAEEILGQFHDTSDDFEFDIGRESSKQRLRE